MSRTTPMVVAGIFVIGATLYEVSSHAQTQGCSADQRLDYWTRRREAIVRARNVNARQTEQHEKSSRYATADELGLKDENGFEMSLGMTADGYVLFIRDTTDPCSSGVVTDHRGPIYDANLIQYRGKG